MDTAKIKEVVEVDVGYNNPVSVLNNYLKLGWVIIGSRIEDNGDPQMGKSEHIVYHLGWTADGAPNRPPAETD